MLKILLSLCLGLLVFAQEGPEPAWIKTDPKESGVFFRGISGSYVTDDPTMLALAEDDALKDAYGKVASYFGVSIISSVEVESKSSLNHHSTKVKKNIKSKTNQLIFNLKPYKIHQAFNEDRSNFRTYVLIRLDALSEQKIRAQMQKDQEEYNALLDEVRQFIDQKLFFKAQNTLDIAKGKRSAYMDDTIAVLQKRLDTLKEGLLLPLMSVNKTTFLPKEEIKVEVSLNQQGYLYLFYDNGQDIELLFPNELMRNNYLKKEQMVLFPNDDVYLSAYEISLEKPVFIRAIASKKRFDLFNQSDDKIDGIHMFAHDASVFEAFDTCISEGECTEDTIALKVTLQTEYEPISFEIHSDQAIENVLLKHLESKGIVSRQSPTKVVFTITSERRYSNQLDSWFTVFSIDAVKTNADHTEEKVRVVCSKSELGEKVEELFHRFASPKS